MPGRARYGGRLCGAGRGGSRRALVLRGRRPLSPGRHALEGERWRDKRIGIVTGTAMGPLIPQIVADLTRITGAHYEILALENTLFGSSVTTAGLLPGKVLPAEAVNDDLLFMDDMEAHDLAARLPMPVRLSYDFADALEERLEGWKVGMNSPSNIPTVQPSRGDL